MSKTKVKQGRPRKEASSKRKEHYRELWREASGRYYAEKHGKPKSAKKVVKTIVKPLIKTKLESHWIRKDVKIDINLAVLAPEIKQDTSKITPKIKQSLSEYMYKPKNLPTHYNLHKKVIKIVPGKYKPEQKKNFIRANITRIRDNIFQCNECGQMWSVNRKTFPYDGDWWRCRNGCNRNA
jgi:hypothetical protein